VRIGVDIDGVMYEWSKTARYMLREILPNSPYTKDGPLGVESQHWDYIQKHVAPEHWKWLWTEGVRLGLFRHGHMCPGTIEAIRKLSELGDIIVVTHRPAAAVADTLAWLSYQRLPLSGIHILTNQEPKSSVAKCDVFIDDKPENCEDLAAIGTAACLMDRPWNQHSSYSPRVYSWQDFEEKAIRTMAVKAKQLRGTK
jgi:5'(3')-deoxyribonucleotidase